ncbi:uncharacterized protein KY384_002022 [Bacidia gigantensis]|uniref:uncharacterized protein n=1 Tax=Bacidia gigantensis TaxID=2732470 RepID=UPI001D04C780|nr:uncharacterized protein KY384_002022 [Bacidia gigantensis]KAG8533239.1 hypothetical protein KY384_002022 [Bacidia gigantensis]
MDKNANLEVTNAFPFPIVEAPTADGYHDTPANLASSAPRAKANISYQAEMIRKLREVNVDANNTGWYTSTNLGHFIHSTFIENQVHYQKDINERTVALVHDVSKSSQGGLSLRAFRLSPAFMTAFKENKFTAESLQKSNLRYQDILLELPLQIHNSHLLTSLLHSLPGATPSPDSQQTQTPTLQSLSQTEDPLSPNFYSLNLSVDPFLTQTTDLLLDSIETHHTELNNYQYYQRQLAREQQKISQWQQKRKSENASRAMAKQSPLPEDEWQRLFKLPQEPGRLETMLNSRQVEQYARQIDGFTAGVTGKMFAVRGNLLPGVEDS